METVKRKDKPDWFALMDRVKAICNIMAVERERQENGQYIASEPSGLSSLAKAIRSNAQRVHEWTSFKREPKAQTVLKILEWVRDQEQAIRTKGNLKAYAAEVERISKL